MKEIPLGHGYVALVDDEDYDWLTNYRWHLYGGSVNTRYAGTSTGSHTIQMHRAIMGVYDDRIVHHIDGNGLNNQKSNLEITTRSRNALYKKAKGYSWDYSSRKWKARIKVHGRSYHIGRYDTEQEAALAYEIAKREALS